MFIQIWKWLDGKKSVSGLVLLFTYGGLLMVGYDIQELKTAAEFLLGVGVVHKLNKAK